MLADNKVLQDSVQKAQLRYGSASQAELEATAYQLTRCYNIIEQLGIRVAKAFENHIDDDLGWHTELIRRMSLEIPKVRPALFPSELLSALHDLRGFRHVVVHSYELELSGDKMRLVLVSAQRVAQTFPEIIGNFFSKLRFY
jgi:hypothetical protein